MICHKCQFAASLFAKFPNLLILEPLGVHTQLLILRLYIDLYFDISGKMLTLAQVQGQKILYRCDTFAQKVHICE